MTTTDTNAPPLPPPPKKKNQKNLSRLPERAFQTYFSVHVTEKQVGRDA